MKGDAAIAAARVEADRARAKLFATAEELQERLSPGTLARGAWEGAKSKGADVAENAVDAVRSRPLAATGVMAAITLFLARQPLMELAGKVAHGFSTKRETKKRQRTSSKTKKDMEAVE